MAMVAHHVLDEQRQIEFDTATLRWYRDSTIERAIDTMTGAIQPDPNAELGGIFRVKSAAELENEDDDANDDLEQPGSQLSAVELIELKNKQREYAKRLEELCALDDEEELQHAKPLDQVPNSTIETTSFRQLDDVDEYGSFPLTQATDLLVWNAQQLAAAAAAAPKKVKSPPPASGPSSGSLTAAATSPPAQPSKRKGFFGLFQ